MTLGIGDWCSGGTGGEGYLFSTRDEVCFSSFSFFSGEGCFVCSLYVFIVPFVLCEAQSRIEHGFVHFQSSAFFCRQSVELLVNVDQDTLAALPWSESCAYACLS